MESLTSDLIGFIFDILDSGSQVTFFFTSKYIQQSLIQEYKHRELVHKHSLCKEIVLQGRIRWRHRGYPKCFNYSRSMIPVLEWA